MRGKLCTVNMSSPSRASCVRTADPAATTAEQKPQKSLQGPFLLAIEALLAEERHGMFRLGS